jgi:hypothetical protein
MKEAIVHGEAPTGAYTRARAHTHTHTHRGGEQRERGGERERGREGERGCDRQTRCWAVLITAFQYIFMAPCSFPVVYYTLPSKPEIDSMTHIPG